MTSTTGKAGTPAFHHGERAVQRAAGVPDAIEDRGRKLIRPFMPEQHREFFETLPFIVCGVLDDDGFPWVHLIEGPSGFIRTSNPETMTISGVGRTLEMLGHSISRGDKIGLLGIELPTRRRNRMNGTVIATDAETWTIHVDQSFGNCAKFIQKRSIVTEQYVADGPLSVSERATHLSTDDMFAVQSADTLFLASRFKDIDDDRRAGVDASHRGGAPGFVRCLNNQTLIFPDFPGNRFYNTLGNLAVDPRLCLLFPNFATGATIQITGTAICLDEPPDGNAYAGAERYVVVEINQVIKAPDGMMVRAKFEEFWRGLSEGDGWET